MHFSMQQGRDPVRESIKIKVFLFLESLSFECFSFFLCLAANQAEAFVSETLPLRYPFAAVQATEHTRPRQARSQLQPLPT